MSLKYQQSAHILDARIGDDFVALNRSRGLCFGMSDVAAEVWASLAQPQSVSDICARLVARYDVDEARCRSDISAFFSDLLAEGAIELVTPDN